MRPLFTLARGLLLVCLLPLAACDSTRDGAEVGAWELVGITDARGEAVEAPVGSQLVFASDGAFAIESGNSCSGRYRSEFMVNQQVLTLDFDTCTEAGTTFETDLSIVLGAFQADVALEGPAFYAAEPQRMEIVVFARSVYTLTFRAE